MYNCLMHIILQQQHNDLDITIRYPQKEDTKQLHYFINQLSQERTYIRKQGEVVSHEKQENYVDDLLTKIRKKTAVQLLALHNDQLIGSAGVVLGTLIQKHIGTFSIAVIQEYRGKGVGNLLMKTVFEESKKELPGLEILKLAVQVPNKIAIEMYKKNGFLEYGRLPDGVKIENGYRDHILMYKRLPLRRSYSSDSKKLINSKNCKFSNVFFGI